MRRTWISLTLLALVALSPAVLHAQDVEEGTITVIQPKPVLRLHRVEFAPRFGSTMNDAIVHQYAVGGALNYNISERLFLGASFDWFDLGDIGGVTQGYEDVIATTTGIPQVAPLRWYGGLDVGWVPVYGKYVLFNQIIGYYDLYALFGAGVVESNTPMHPGGSIGFGSHIYLTKWLSLNVEVRNRMSIEELPDGSALQHATLVGGGINIFIPFGFRYSFAEDEEAEEVDR